MIILFLLSLLVTSLTSFFIAFGFYFIAPNIAFAIFWVTFGFLWVIMEPINRRLRIKSIAREKEAMETAKELGEVLSKQTIMLECEYCKKPNAVKIHLNEKNAFICKACKNANNITIRFGTTRVTDPLQLESEALEAEQEVIEENV